MIVSVSRRTDIPAFYSKWFMNRVREGFLVKVNPLNAKQKKAISLHSVIKMVPAQPSSIDILPEADEEDCGVLFWWRRKPLPLNLK